MSADPSPQNLPNSSWCFVCGEDNHAGLQTRFFVEGDAVKTVLTPQMYHCGYKNVVHGGVVAAVLDETMGWAAARAIGLMCYTGELTVRYIRHVPADRNSVVSAVAVKAGRRMAVIQATLQGEDGEIYAHAEGKFLPMSAEETLVVDAMLLYNENDVRLFEHLKSGAV